MHGIITALDEASSTGRIQADDGRILSFSTLGIKGDIHPEASMEVSFDVIEDEAINLVLHPDDNFYDNKVFYKVPKETGLCREGIPDGFELIDRSSHAISLESRNLTRAKWELVNYANECGGNVVLKYTETKFIKNSIGFSLYYYKVSGIPAVIGTKVPSSDTTLSELKHQLNHKKLDEKYNLEVNVNIGKKVITYIGAFLMLIFLMGFLYSL